VLLFFLFLHLGPVPYVSQEHRVCDVVGEGNLKQVRQTWLSPDEHASPSARLCVLVCSWKWGGGGQGGGGSGGDVSSTPGTAFSHQCLVSSTLDVGN
jgi:hypothetical protein